MSGREGEPATAVCELEPGFAPRARSWLFEASSWGLRLLLAVYLLPLLFALLVAALWLTWFLVDTAGLLGLLGVPVIAAGSVALGLRSPLLVDRLMRAWERPGTADGARDGALALGFSLVLLPWALLAGAFAGAVAGQALASDLPLPLLVSPKLAFVLTAQGAGALVLFVARRARWELAPSRPVVSGERPAERAARFERVGRVAVRLGSMWALCGLTVLWACSVALVASPRGALDVGWAWLVGGALLATPLMAGSLVLAARLPALLEAAWHAPRSGRVEREVARASAFSLLALPIVLAASALVAGALGRERAPVVLALLAPLGQAAVAWALFAVRAGPRE